MSIINNLTIVLIISSMSLQCVSPKTWDLTDIDDMDNLLSSWLTYGRQIYYQYQLEGDAIFCVINGIWKIVRNHIIEQSRISPQTSTSKVAEGFNSESIEKYDVTTEESRPKRSVKKVISIADQRRINASIVSSLLGITGKRYAWDYDRTFVRVKKSVKRTWDDDVKVGDLERAILKSLAKSNPLINVLLNFLGNIIYLVHSIWAFMKSSVVLTCVSDYTISRSSEFMYLDV